MAKAKTRFVCTECGAEHARWQGNCVECRAWNCLTEISLDRLPTSQRPVSRIHQAWTGQVDPAKITSLQDVVQTSQTRFVTGLSELDRVLGGGLVAGSVVLVGGDPGIGKSTLLLQALAHLADSVSVLYVSGEESLAQLASRASRLSLPLQGLNALAETQVDAVLQHADHAKPKLIVADSIQTFWCDGFTAAPGSVTQVRESAAQLVRYAKETGTTIFLVGHVTKEGGIAGPRVLEHMVDAVLYFEGDVGSRFRLLRAFKNRFGAVNELGVFAMGEKGLRPVANPSALFLTGSHAQQPGSCVMVTREGTRPLMVEVQALVDQTSIAHPRRVTVGLEQNRLAMLLAVLHRHGGLQLSDQDVFINVVGGMRLQETAVDLPALLAVVSSLRDRALVAKTVAFGEIGLSGELRPVPNGEERLKEAVSHGFEQAIIPIANAPKNRSLAGLQIIAVGSLRQALDAVD